ncbi:hypothetical protein M2271_000197 [Streptomyces sp. LBL]|uniref:hypothetical protein n=1 Tax=Streptomyces sp. LBL TaxID=2940562 RepID=UPI002473CBBF|nr:hypothetical protein [Streptomyces sp. LBL]MDH6622410.1 hypothetical protein [Streptomyces sp. LBL]
MTPTNHAMAIPGMKGRRGRDGLTVRTDTFTAVIGEPAGDAHAEPELTLRAAAG